MGRRADINIADVGAANWSGAGTNYIVKANNGALYMVYINTASDVVYKKSLDGGMTWSSAVAALASGTAIQLAVWYDRWTDPSGTLGDYIHIASVDSGTDDTSYRTIDTASSDALSTQVAVQATLLTAIAGGHISITRAVSGNVYIEAVIDAGAEGDFYRLTQANFPNGAWDNRTLGELATLDQIILQPDFDAADTSDILAFFQDASVTEISRKLYDDSGDSWGETSINNAVTELSTATAFANLAAAPDISGNRSILVVWTGTDAANADLKCYSVDSGTITELTDVVLNSTDDQGLCAIGIATDTGYWHVFYCGASGGGETWNTALNVYTKVSTDSGTTWGPETLISVGGAATIRHLYTAPIFTGKPVVAWVQDGAVMDDLVISVDVTQPKAQYSLGV